MDLNGDGRTDLLSGSYSPGEIRLFPRLEDGSFGPAEILKGKDGNPVLVGRASAVFAFDWDRDGDLDLLAGNIEGQVHLVPNESDGESLVFGTPVKLEAEGKAAPAE